jgi:hypothetical protein
MVIAKASVLGFHVLEISNYKISNVKFCMELGRSSANRFCMELRILTVTNTVLEQTFDILCDHFNTVYFVVGITQRNDHSVSFRVLSYVHKTE